MASPADARKARKPPPAIAPTYVSVYPKYHGSYPPDRGANLFPAGPIMYGSEYLGDDPDPFIRAQIWRDLGAHFGGAF